MHCDDVVGVVDGDVGQEHFGTTVGRVDDRFEKCIVCKAVCAVERLEERRVVTAEDIRLGGVERCECCGRRRGRGCGTGGRYGLKLFYQQSLVTDKGKE